MPHTAVIACERTVTTQRRLPQRLFFALLLWTLSKALLARPGAMIGEVDVTGTALPVFEIAVVEGDAERESLHDFIARVAIAMHDWTRANDHEVCAGVCRNATSTRLAARLLTVHSHTACPLIAACPDGFVATVVHLHTHSQLRRYRPNEVDRHFVSNRAIRTRMARNDYPDQFSVADRALPAGYLVGKRALHGPDGRYRVAIDDLRRRVANALRHSPLARPDRDERIATR